MKNTDEKQCGTAIGSDRSTALNGELETLRERLRWAQESQQLAVRILALLNRQVACLDAIREVLRMVREFTGYEAVGIRLRDGEDFPYFETQGFPAHFVEGENVLCRRNQDGEIIRDSIGNPILDCMCGNVIQGRTNPSFSFFTQGGSFWSNNTTELLATTSEEDRQARTRNRCNGEGYESVALIPLRTDREIIGLLQLNDSRTNCFTPDMISFFEGIGASIGVVLERKFSEEALKRAQEDLDIMVRERTQKLREIINLLKEEGAGREQAQVALRHSEEVYRHLVENVGLGISLIDSDHNIIVSNTVVGEWFNRPASEFSGNKCFREFERRAAVCAHCPGVLAMATGQPAEAETEGVRGDGTRVVAHLRAFPTFGRDGAATGFIEVIENITERRQAEEALKESEERFRAVFESPHAVMLIIDPDTGKIEDCSPGACAFYGYSREDLRKKRIGEINTLPPEEAFKLLQMAKSKQRKYFDFQHRIASGEIRDVEVCTGPIVIGGKTLLFSVINDVTERKQAAEALRKSEELYRTLVENIDVGISLIDADHNIVMANTTFGKWYDRPTSEFAGRKCFEAFRKLEAVCPECPGVLAMATGQAADTENEGVRDDGTLISVRVRAFPMSGQDGVPSGFIELVEDVTERKRARDALIESEQRFRAIFDNYHAVMFIIDPETGRIEDASPGASTFYGYSIEELKKKTIFEINGMPAERLLENLQIATSQDRKYLDYQHRLADGQIRDVEVCSGPITIEGRALLFSVVTDVSDRKRAEEAIRESEARVRMKLDSILSPEGDLGILELADVIDVQAIQALMDDFFSLTNIGVGIVDLEGKILVATGWQEICTKFHRAHPETCKYCLESDTLLSAGLEQGSFKLYRCQNNMWDIATPIMVGGRHLGNLFLGQFLFEGESPDEELFRTQAHQYGFNEEEYLSALESVPRWSRETVDTAMAFYAKLGSILSSLSYSNIKLARSLAEQERLANSLRESEQRYRALFDESRDGVWWTAQDGTLIEANQAFLDLFGLTREEARHWNVVNGYRDPEDRRRFRKTILREGSVEDFDLKLKKKDGTEIDCLLTATLRLNEEGDVVGYQGIIRDITERKKLEQQLLQAQKMEAIGTLAGGIAHDFNNLLTVILGYSELIISEKNERDRDYEDLKKVIHAGRTAADMVQQILAFSRKTETKFWPINLNKQVPQLRKMLSRLIPKTIEVQIALDPKLPTVNADPAQIDQILMNLAVNARDAMPDGGKLAIETKAVVLDDEYCSAHIEASKGLHALLTVSDTGTGIDRASSDRIFEPFYTTKKPGQGTGLGLAMVYGIVKGHGGHISVHSEVGAGTAFRIYIPAHQVEGELDVAASAAFSALGTGTILLADDEELVRSLGERILSKAGCKILTACNGREALEIYRQRRDEISLVILDLIMPVMDGKQCLDEILKVNPQAKVLIASGYSPDGATQELLEGRAKGLVNKPYNISQMVQSVREALDSD